MIFRYFPRGLDLLKINIVVLMLLPSSTGKPNFYPVNSCTDIKLNEIPEDVFQKCSETNSAIHCLPDESNNLGLSCFQVTWISEGKCPSYNSYQGNMDEKACSTDHNGECPSALFKSPLSVRYTGCYIKELIPLPTTTPSMTIMTTKTMTTKTPTTSKNSSSDPTANVSIIAEKMSETNQTGVSECGKGLMIALFIILLSAVALIAADCVVYKRILCGNCKQKIRKEFCRVLPKFCYNREAQNADSQPQDRDDGSRKPMVKIVIPNGS